MQKSSKQENFGSKYENGTEKRNDQRKPLDFPLLQKMYDNAINQFIDLLERINPEITLKLLNSTLTPQTPSMPSKEYNEKASLEPTQTTENEEFPESDSHIFYNDSEKEFNEESTPATIQRAESPRTTKLEYAGPNKIEDENKTPSKSPQGSYPLQGHLFPQTPPGEGVRAGYPKGPNQQQTRPGEGVHGGYPQGPNQQQTRPGQGVHGGYPQGTYQPQPPPGEGVSAGYKQGPYQQPKQPGQRVQAEYQQGSYQQQTTHYKALPKSDVELFDKESEVESDDDSTSSLVLRGESPQATKLTPLLTPMLIDFAINTILPPLAEKVGHYITEHSGPHRPPTDNMPPSRSQQALNTQRNLQPQSALAPGVLSGQPQGPYQPGTQPNPTLTSQRPIQGPYNVYNQETPPYQRQTFPTGYPQGIYQPLIQPGPFLQEIQRPPLGNNQQLRLPGQGVPAGYPQGPYQPQTLPGQSPQGFQNPPYNLYQPQPLQNIGFSGQYPQYLYQPQTSPEQTPPTPQKPTQGLYQPQTRGYEVPAGYPQAPYQIQTRPDKTLPGSQKPERGLYEQQIPPDLRFPARYPPDPEIYAQPLTKYSEAKPEEKYISSFIERGESPNVTKTSPGQIPPERLNPKQGPYKRKPPPGQAKSYTQAQDNGFDDESIHSVIDRAESPNMTKSANVRPGGPMQPQTPKGLQEFYQPQTSPEETPPNPLKPTQGLYQPQTTGHEVPAGNPQDPQQHDPPSPYSQPGRQYPTTPWDPPPLAFGQYALPTKLRSSGPKYGSIFKMSPGGKHVDKKNKHVAFDKLQVEVLTSLKDINDQINFILGKLQSK